MTLSVEEFYRELQAAFCKHLPSLELKDHERNPVRLEVRILLSPSSFIDVFYGARKHRIDFALIHEGKRIFGIDNLHYWHCHPLGRERDHVQIAPMSIEEIVLEFKKNIEKLESDREES